MNIEEAYQWLHGDRVEYSRCRAVAETYNAALAAANTRIKELEANYAAVAHNIASSPAKVLEESVLIGQALNRLDKVQQALLSEREVSDKLEKALQKLSLYIAHNGDDWVKRQAEATLAEASNLRANIAAIRTTQTK